MQEREKQTPFDFGASSHYSNAIILQAHGYTFRAGGWLRHHLLYRRVAFGGGAHGASQGMQRTVGRIGCRG